MTPLSQRKCKSEQNQNMSDHYCSQDCTIEWTYRNINDRIPNCDWFRRAWHRKETFKCSRTSERSVRQIWRVENSGLWSSGMWVRDGLFGTACSRLLIRNWGRQDWKLRQAGVCQVEWPKIPREGTLKRRRRKDALCSQPPPSPSQVSLSQTITSKRWIAPHWNTRPR